MGHTITTGQASYMFPSNLPIQTMCSPYYGCADGMMMNPMSPQMVMPSVTSTAGTRVLIGTQGLAALGVITPDFIVPNGFLPIGGGTITYAEGTDQWTFGALPTDGVTALRRSGGAVQMVQNVAMNFSGQSVSVSAPGGPDLDQHGLTGSWFKQATNGQGIEVEVFPDMSGPGQGFIQVSWFTYDGVVGGADHQRWYTASGPVTSGQSSASLTIYQNVGGNFAAPPVTPAQPVGTATLSFDSCTSGQLSYSFTDGTNRTGVIPLTRITQNVTCSTTAARPTNPDFGLSGNWFDMATSGQGITSEVNPISGALFAAWYTYAPNGAAAGAAGQRWYTAQQTTAFTAGMRSIPVTIYETTGGMFDAPTVPAPNTVPVGTGTLAFQSCANATLNYNFTGGTSSGLSGTINLIRPGPVPAGCTM